jgi:hypothetical protein
VSTIAGHNLLCKKDGTILTNVKGTCSGCCDYCEKFCYARKFSIRRNHTVIPAYNENTLLLRERPEQYYEEIEEKLRENKDATLRLHVSGEFEIKDQMEEHARIARKTDNIQYFYTERHSWLEDLDDAGLLPDNIRPTVSMLDGKRYKNPHEFHGFYIDDGTDPEIMAMVHCPAVNKYGRETGVTCDVCRRCIEAKRGMKTAVYVH